MARGDADDVAKTAAQNRLVGLPAVGTKGRALEDEGPTSPMLKGYRKSGRQGNTGGDNASWC